uniref:SRCR domain-containing protein n=1 Tax=Neolamprologus brichardi TaxID=32507 RepID=A0A3Q4GF81_NEOBR
MFDELIETLNLKLPDTQKMSLFLCFMLWSLPHNVDHVRLVRGTSHCAGALELKHLGEWRPVKAIDWTLKTAASVFRRLEVKSNQSWSSVCEADFDQQDAEVVCRELGCGPPSVLQGALYGEVEAPVWSKEFQCGGHESALLDCRSSGSARNSCSAGKAVGLTCSEPFDLRLVGGESRCDGTLEVKMGEWRPVYAFQWTLNEAAVFCEHLNCGSVLSKQERNQTNSRGTWWLKNDCIESSPDLRVCVTSGITELILHLTCSGKHISDLYMSTQEDPELTVTSMFVLLKMTKLGKQRKTSKELISCLNEFLS